MFGFRGGESESDLARLTGYRADAQKNGRRSRTWTCPRSRGRRSSYPRSGSATAYLMPRRKQT